MKHTNLVAPRSMAECNFRASDDPIEAFGPNRRYASVAVFVTLIVGAIAAVAVAALS